MSTVRQSIARIRAFAAAQGWRKGRLAGEAGINDTTLRNFHDDDWNPTAETLEKLEAVIPAAWMPGDTISCDTESNGAGAAA